MGRKGLDEDERTVFVTIRIPEGVRDELDKLLSGTDRTRSELIRDLVCEWTYKKRRVRNDREVAKRIPPRSR